MQTPQHSKAVYGALPGDLPLSYRPSNNHIKIKIKNPLEKRIYNYLSLLFSFFVSGNRLPDKCPEFFEFIDIVSADITHRGTKPSEQFINHSFYRSGIGHSPRHSFRSPHRVQTSGLDHIKLMLRRCGTAVHFPLLISVPEHFSGRFVRAGKQTADHYRLRACYQRLAQISAALNSAIGNNRYGMHSRNRGTGNNRGNLRNPNP